MLYLLYFFYSYIKMFSFVKLIVKLHEGIINYIERYHPNIDKLIFYESEQYNIVKIVFCYFYGIFLAYIFWDFFIFNIGFSTEFTYNLLAITTIFLGELLILYVFLLICWPMGKIIIYAG